MLPDRLVRWPSLYLAALLAGCQSALPLAPASGPERRLVIDLALPRQVQATVSRNLTSMLDHYTATLLKWDGSSFVPLSTPLSITTTELVRPKFAFDHLGPGRYHVRAIGYDASNTALTSEGSADIDMTGNDVDLSPHVTVPMTMLPVAFSATLPLPSNAVISGSVPHWVTGLEAVVSVGGTEIARQSYTAGQAPELKNLAAGVSYDVTVTATNRFGATSADTYVYWADPTAATLDDAPSHACSWITPAPVVSTFAVGTGPFAIAVDPAGNAWVSYYTTANATRISPTGSLSTFSVGTNPRSITTDAAGNAWVANRGSANVTRISATGSISTFAVGTNPSYVMADASGNVWVTNSGSASVTRISTTGSISTFAVGTTPNFVMVDASGNTWVTNGGSANVTRISATGSLSTFAVGTTPCYVAVDSSGNVWVTNSGSSNVSRISSTGSQTTIPVSSSPRVVVVDANDNAWVTNGSNKVTRFSVTSSPTTFTIGLDPLAMALDPDGNVWVVNNDSDSLTRISSTGNQTTFTMGTGPGAVAVDANGNVWVPNYSSNNVTMLAF